MHLPLTLPLGDSKRLAALLSLAHLFAAGALLATAIPWAIRLVLLAAVAFSAFRSVVRRHASVRALHLGARGELAVETKLGARVTASVDPDTMLFPGLVVLVVRQDGQRLVLPLMADAVGTDGFRQLRIWLRWRARADNAFSA